MLRRPKSIIESVTDEVSRPPVESPGESNAYSLVCRWVKHLGVLIQAAPGRALLPPRWTME
jgi:hypothetical protein